MKKLSLLKKLIDELRQYSVPGDNWSFSSHKNENFAAYNTMWERLDSAFEEFKFLLDKEIKNHH